MLNWLRHCDRELFLFINSHHNLTFDWIMYHVSLTLTWVPLYLCILYYIFKKYPKTTVWYVVLTIVLSVGLSNFISSELLKTTVHRLRPSHVPELQQYIHLVRNYSGGKFGFASSHAANMTAIAVCTSYFLTKKWITISMCVWALFVSYSRIYLGVHYPGDVLGGIFIGFGVSVTVIYFYNLKFKNRNS